MTRRLVAEHVSCTRCDGHGRVALAVHYPEYAATLALVRAGVETAVELHRRMGGIGAPTAANNRLEWLRRHGFVRRERDGRTWRYVATSGGAS